MASISYPIKRTLERFPGGMMVIPLLAGALVNTIDQLHLAPVQWVLRRLGAPAVTLPDGTQVYEMLQIGGFSQALVKGGGALTLIGLFLFCVGAQMNFRVGGRALRKGLVLTGAKFGAAVGMGYLLGRLTGNIYHGFLGLSVMAIIAAMENGNGGMYAALTGQYGNRSDVGALSVVSLNDGPFFTLVALGLLGQTIPFMAFVAVLLPMGIGFAAGNLDPEMRDFLAPGEKLLIPFFAFALGTTMNLGVFGERDVLAGGLFLALATVAITGGAMAFLLWLTGERSQTAGIAEASTAGNATMTPLAVATVAGVSADAAASALAVAREAPGAAPELLARLEANALETAEVAAQYEGLVTTASAQISISVLTTALVCPFLVIAWDRWQRTRGIDGTHELPPDTGPTTVDGRVVRIVAGMVFAASLIYVLVTPWIAVLLAADFLVRGFGRARYSPFALVARAALRLAQGPPRPVPGPPKRFAAQLGFGLSLILCGQLMGGTPPVYAAFGLLLAVLSGLEAFGNICVGCLLHRRLWPPAAPSS